MIHILTFDDFVARMYARWGKSVTLADYQRYVEETHLDARYLKQAEASKRRLLAA